MFLSDSLVSVFFGKKRTPNVYYVNWGVDRGGDCFS